MCFFWTVCGIDGIISPSGKGKSFILLSWEQVPRFRNDTPQFSVPTETPNHAAACLLPLVHFSLPPPVGWRGKLRHKTWGSRVEIKTTYWKQQWKKKTTSNKSNTKDRGCKRRNIAAHLGNPWQDTIPNCPLQLRTGINTATPSSS